MKVLTTRLILASTEKKVATKTLRSFKTEFFFLTSLFNEESKKVILYLRYYEGNGILSEPVQVSTKTKLYDYLHDSFQRAGQGTRREKNIRAGMAYFASRLVVSDDTSHLAIISGDADFDSFEGMNNWTVRLMNSDMSLNEPISFLAEEQDIYLEELVLIGNSLFAAVGVEGVHKSPNGYPTREVINYNPHFNFNGQGYSLIAVNMKTGHCFKSKLVDVANDEYDLSVYNDKVLFATLKDQKTKEEVDLELTQYSLSTQGELIFDMKSEIVTLDYEKSKTNISRSELKIMHNSIGEPKLILEHRRWIDMEEPYLACFDLDIVQFDKDLQRDWLYHLDRFSSGSRSYHHSSAGLTSVKDHLVIYTLNNSKDAENYLSEDIKKGSYCATLTVLGPDGGDDHKLIYTSTHGPYTTRMNYARMVVHGDKVYFVTSKVVVAGVIMAIGQSNKIW